jgi:phosphoribosylglycinamide formyltransferase-1
VILAGYMKLLGPQTLARYRGRILNIHPALLPKFGGKGLYGKKVHEAVLAAGERVTGVTVHLVDERYDSGPILAQSEVPVLEGDTVDSLADRVLVREHELYAETIERIVQGEIDLDAVGS